MTEPKTTAIAKPLGSMTAADFSALAKSDPDAAGRMMYALASARTADMPDTVFVRRHDDATLKRVQVNLSLRESEGEIIGVPVRVPDRQGGGREKKTVIRYTPTAQGFSRINEVAGVQIISPDWVMVEDKRQPNPFVLIDPDSKTPAVVYCRKIAIGRSTVTGNLSATDVMVRLDINLYFLETIISKLKWITDEATADEFAQYGVREEPPKGSGWHFRPIASGGIGLWINYRHHRMKEIFSDHITRMKFVERVAQTMAERNALKKNAAIPSTFKGTNGVVATRVHSWVTDFDRSELERIRTMAQEGSLHEHPDIIDVEVVNVSETDLDEGDMAAADDEAAVESREEHHAESEAVGSVQEVDLLPAAMERYEEWRDTHGAKAAKAALAALEITSLEEATPAQLRAVLEHEIG